MFSRNAYIESFKLAGLIVPENGSAGKKLAMVEDVSGRGYMLREGTSIGPGRVSAIFKDRIIIAIETRDDRGRTHIRRKELVLNKFSGGKANDIK